MEFRRYYLVFVFLIIFVANYFLFSLQFNVLALLFLLVFSLSLTCIIRNMISRFKLARSYQGSILGIIGTTIGISALQVCGASAPACSAAIGIGIFSSTIPAAAVFVENRELMLGLAILAQAVALYFMKCFK